MKDISSTVIFILILIFQGLLGGPALAALPHELQESFQEWLPADQVATLKPEMQSINILSGYPLKSSEDTTGGFGDVAINLVSALKMKKMYPHLTINFLVTSEKEVLPGALNSNQIVKLMMPQLDPTRPDSRQVIEGINVYFVSTPVETLKESVPSEVLDRLPKADLTLQFSANNVGLRHFADDLSAVNIDFMEFGAPAKGKYFGVFRSRLFDKNGSEEEPNGNVRMPRMTFNSGPEYAGFFPFKSQRASGAPDRRKLNNGCGKIMFFVIR